MPTVLSGTSPAILASVGRGCNATAVFGCQSSVGGGHRREFARVETSWGRIPGSTTKAWNVRAGIQGPLISPDLTVWLEGSFTHINAPPVGVLGYPRL